MGGYTQAHADLEAAIADLKQTQACLLFSSGFAANLAVVSALCQDGNAVIFSDELNHASIIDGARLASRKHPGMLQVREQHLNFDDGCRQHSDMLRGLSLEGARRSHKCQAEVQICWSVLTSDNAVDSA